MLGQATGVGHYGLSLLAGLEDLQAAGALEAVDVFDGRQIVAAREFRATATQPARAARWETYKRLIRRWLPGYRALGQRWWAHRLRALQARGRWQVFHEPNFVPSARELPVVTTVPDLAHVRYPQFCLPARLEWLRTQLAESLRRSQVIVAISEFTKRELLQVFPRLHPERVFVTPLGVDGQVFRPQADAPGDQEVRRRWQLPSQFLLYVGTLEPRKNLLGLLQAYRLLPRELRREFPLVLAGMRGWSLDELDGSLDALEAEGSLRQLGYVPASDLPALYRAASVFCFPSFYEGFGLPPLEAAACGTPVLASDVAALPEVLGDAACYADPHEPPQIAGELRRLLDDAALRSRLGAAGARRAANFTWRRCAEATLSAYRAAA